MKTTTFNIIGAQSQVNWTGRKVTGAHNGTIRLKEGSLSLEEGKLTGGRIVIDTTAISILDVTDPATNAQFAGHLASDDFFASAQHPEAVLTITAVNGTRIYGDLTIKGITHPVAFDASVQLNGNTVAATGKITIDRTKYNMKFRSGNFFQNLGDTLIYNDFDLNVAVIAESVTETVSL